MDASIVTEIFVPTSCTMISPNEIDHLSATIKSLNEQIMKEVLYFSTNKLIWNILILKKNFLIKYYQTIEQLFLFFFLLKNNPMRYQLFNNHGMNSNQEGELSKVRSNLKYKSLPMVEKMICRLQQALQTRNFPLSEESKIVVEINDLNRSKKHIQ